jgi:hypothetical protein
MPEGRSTRRGLRPPACQARLLAHVSSGCLHFQWHCHFRLPIRSTVFCCGPSATQCLPDRCPLPRCYRLVGHQLRLGLGQSWPHSPRLILRPRKGRLLNDAYCCFSSFHLLPFRVAARVPSATNMLKLRMIAFESTLEHYSCTDCTSPSVLARRQILF